MSTGGEKKKPKTWKRMLIMIGLVLLLIGVIAGIKVLLVMKMISGMKPPPPAVVSTAKASYKKWQPTLGAVGTLRGVRGADLALDVSGLVTEVNLKSGDDVKQGEVLLRLRDSEDVALLRQLEAAATLADVTFGRAKRQLAVQAISKADYDAAAADLKGKQAAVQQQRVTVARKQLRAPFAGRVGIITISPGTYLNSGTTIVTLQQVDPLYADFYVPQRSLGELRIGQNVSLNLDSLPTRHFDGAITAVSPKVDTDTRNVLVEASLPNPDHALTPGMFANISIDVGGAKRYLTLPQTAVVYNPYGETVYVVTKKSEFDKAQASAAAKSGESAKDKGKENGKRQGAGLSPDALVVQQTFVTTGAKRGDQVAIVKGIDEGAEVVTSGQIKLKSGAPITIDNKVRPADSAHPKPQED
ncbi:MAG: efflux RND transporter periplasmic adaptor subunit [Rhodanobacteraceae bacterium]